MPRPGTGAWRLLALTSLILLSLSAGCLGGGCQQVTDFPDETRSYGVQVDGERVGELTLEIADDREERARGLMFREELSRGRGMLFVYGGEAPRSFWMKNTLVPLDMVFLDSGFRVVKIHQADPEPGVPDFELRSYRSGEPARYVLEVRQGVVADLGIEEGSRLTFCR